MHTNWEEKFGPGTTDYFGEEHLERLTSIFDVTSPILLELLQKLHAEATKETREEDIEKIRRYWNLYRAAILIIGNQLGLYSYKNSYIDYSLEELTFILNAYQVLSDCDAKFIKSFWDRMLYLRIECDMP